MPDNIGLNLLTTEYGGLGAESFRDFASVKTVSDESLIPEVLASGSTDVLVMLYTQGHENAGAEAVKAAENTCIAVLLVSRVPLPPALQKKCEASGVLITDTERLPLMLQAAAAMRTRLRKLENRTGVLQQKLDDTKLVTRAKLLLMTRLQMSESEAHRYIEKRAMDTSVRRRDIAESIIKTYEG